MPVESIVEKYQKLKAKKESLEKSLTIKETEFKTLKQQYSDELKEVCDEYKVSSLEELEVLVAKEEKSLEEEIAKIESTLNTDIDV